MESRTSNFERAIEILLYPGLAVLPYLLFREFMVSTVRNNPWIFIYITSFAAISTLAVAMPYAIAGLEQKRKPFAIVFAAVLISSAVGAAAINIFASSPAVFLSVFFLLAVAALVSAFFLLNSKNEQNILDLAYALGITLIGVALPYLLTRAGIEINASAASLPAGAGPASAAGAGVAIHPAIIILCGLPLAAPLPFLLCGPGGRLKPNDYIISSAIGAFGVLFAYILYAIYVQKSSAFDYGLGIFNHTDTNLFFFIFAVALACVFALFILARFDSAAGKSARPLDRLIAMYITTSLAYSVYFVIFRSFESFRLPQQTVMQITLAFILLLFFTSSFVKGRLELRKIPFNLPILLITILSLFSFVLSPNFFISLKEFAQYGFVILNFYLLIHCLDAKKHYNSLIAVFIAVMAVEGIIGVIQHFGANVLIGLGTNVDPFSTLGNKNYVAEMLAMTIPFALAVSVASREWWKKLLCWLAIIPMLMVVLVSVTRGSWIGLLASSLVFFLFAIDGLPKKKAIEAAAHLAGLAAAALIFMCLSTNRIVFRPPDYSYASRFLSIINIIQDQLGKSPVLWVPFIGGIVAMTAGVWFLLRKPRGRLIGTIAVAAIMILIVVRAAPNKNSRTPPHAAQTAQNQLEPVARVEDSIVSRRFIWGGSKEMIRHYPMGVGLGAYKIRYLSMLKTYLRVTKQNSIPGFFKDVNAKEAHNEYLHFWAELGPLGPLLVIFFIVVVVRQFYKTYYQLKDDTYTQIVLLGAFSGLVSTGASAVIGFPYHIIGTSTFCGVFLALMVFSEDRRTGVETLPPELPGFKSRRSAPAPAAQKEASKSGQSKKKKGKGGNQEAAKPVPIDDSWKKHWVVANLNIAAGVIGYLVLAVFLAVISILSCNIQMANIVMKEANYMGKAATVEEQKAQALDAYTESLRLDPYNGDIHLFLGMFHQSNGRNDKAMDEFLKAKKYYDLPQISLNLGAVYFEKGEAYYDKAAELFQESLAVYPNYHYPRFNLGLIYYTKAVALLDSNGITLEKSGERPAGPGEMKSDDSSIELKGATVEQQAREYLHKAADMFIESLKIDPSLDTASFKLALTYEKLGDFDLAIQWYLYTIRINPNHADAHYNYGLVMARQSSQYNTMGDQAMKAGRAEDARRDYASGTRLQQMSVKEFETTVRIAPTHYKALNNMGNIYFNDGRPDKAIELYEKALKADPSYINARLNIALALVNMNQFEKALSYLIDLVGKPLEPSYEIKTILLIATCYMNMNRAGEGEAVLENVISKYSATQYAATAEYISAVIRYSSLLDVNGKSRKAVEVILPVFGRPLPAYLEAEALFRLGAAAANSGQYGRSADAYQRLVSRFPQSPYAGQARPYLQKVRQLSR